MRNRLPLGGNDAARGCLRNWAMPACNAGLHKPLFFYTVSAFAHLTACWPCRSRCVRIRRCSS
ncbi:hypothetical protein Y027_5158 [Burkholderia pseudomallei TSV5]|nr:hypothetical protein Y027_5158 [Burkholderia pseudomallei TSV5]